MYTIGWSDLVLFRFLNTLYNVHISADQVYFQEFNSKNQQFRPRGKVLILKKSQGYQNYTLKKSESFLKHKKQKPKIKFEIKICLVFL